MKRTFLAAALCAGFAVSASAEAPSAADVAAATAAHKALTTALTKADFGTMFKALPASYKSAAVGAAKAFAGKMDADVWKAGQGALVQVAATVVKQNAFIQDMAKQQGSDIPGAASDDEARTFLVRTGAKLGAIARAASLEKLAAGDLQALFDTPALTMKGITDAVADIAVPDYTATANEDGSVTLVSSKDANDTDRMVKVEGLWIPEALVEAFAEKDSWVADIAQMKPLDAQSKQQATMVIGMVQNAAKSAGQAKTAEEFQGALMQGMMPLMMMGGALMGPAEGAPFGGDDEIEVEEATDDAA